MILHLVRIDVTLFLLCVCVVAEEDRYKSDILKLNSKWKLLYHLDQARYLFHHYNICFNHVMYNNNVKVIPMR